MTRKWACPFYTVKQTRPVNDASCQLETGSTRRLLPPPFPPPPPSVLPPSSLRLHPPPRSALHRNSFHVIHVAFLIHRLGGAGQFHRSCRRRCRGHHSRRDVAVATAAPSHRLLLGPRLICYRIGFRNQTSKLIVSRQKQLAVVPNIRTQVRGSYVGKYVGRQVGTQVRATLSGRNPRNRGESPERCRDD